MCKKITGHLIIRVECLNKEHWRVHRISTGGSVVECSPATRAARVRFPASAFVFESFLNIFLVIVTRSVNLIHYVKILFKKW